MTTISRTTFSNAFLIRMFEFRSIFHWSLFLRLELTIFQRLVGAKPLSWFLMVNFLTHMWVTRSQWVEEWLILIIDSKYDNRQYAATCTWTGNYRLSNLNIMWVAEFSWLNVEQYVMNAHHEQGNVDRRNYAHMLGQPWKNNPEK